MSKIKNAKLDQYGAEPFEQQQFGTAGIEGLIKTKIIFYKGLIISDVKGHTPTSVSFSKSKSSALETRTLCYY